MSEQKAPEDWTPVERIRYLLDQWDVIFDPNITSPNGEAGDGDGVPLLPLMARHKTVRELERCLALLVLNDRVAYCHLKAFRCAAEWRQVRTKIKFRGPNGRMLEGSGWKRERIIPRWIDHRKVRDGEDFIFRTFRGQVFIPKELWDGLTKPYVSKCGT